MLLPTLDLGLGNLEADLVFWASKQVGKRAWFRFRRSGELVIPLEREHPRPHKRSVKLLIPQ